MFTTGQCTVSTLPLVDTIQSAVYSSECNPSPADIYAITCTPQRGRAFSRPGAGDRPRAKDSGHSSGVSGGEKVRRFAGLVKISPQKCSK